MSESKLVEAYLASLAKELEVLGSSEVKDVVAEVREHLAEALAEANGDAAAVTAAFGTPQALAARILEERGILTPDPLVPEAPRALRILALVADLALWALIAAFFFLPPLAALIFAGFADLGATTLCVAMIAAFVGLGTWYWILRATPGRSSIGMMAFGLKRVRFGTRGRIVRTRSIPGSPRGRAIVPAIVVIAVLAGLIPLAWNLRQVYVEGEKIRIQTILSTTTEAQANVMGLYDSALATGTVQEPGTYFEQTPALTKAIAELRARHAAGEADTWYPIASPATFDSVWGGADPTTVDVTVQVYESSSKTDHTATYEYHLRRITRTTVVEQSLLSRSETSEVVWQIISVKKAE